MRPALASLILSLALLTPNGAPAARELAVEPDQLIAVELASVGVVPMMGTPVVLLREPDSGNIVPIFIGPTEARAIIMAQRGIESHRPMTHDLLVNLLESMGGTLQRVIVDELSNGTYHGALEIELADGSTTRIDTRPSDGLAMAVRSGAAILVSQSVLDAGADIPFEGLGDEDVVTALGITVMSATNDLRQALELPDEPGVLISSVSGMAAVAGIQPGALIVRVNDRTAVTPLTFLELVNDTDAGQKARLDYWYEGELQSVELDTDVESGSPPTEPRRRL